MKMKLLFSTTNVHPRDRLDYWHDVVRKHFTDHDFVPECREWFHAELQSGTLSDLRLFMRETSPMSASHTAHHVARMDTDQLFVCRQVAGEAAIEQVGREVALAPGDLALLDPRLPYVAKFSSGSKSLVLKVPRRSLEARTGKTRELIARVMKPSQAENSVSSSFLAMLPSHAGRLGLAAKELIKDQALDLLAVALAKLTEEGRLARISSARLVVLVTVRAVIEARLTDPTLNAETVAAAAGISVRYANAVLAAEDTSIRRLIQTRRLERCRRALEDPSQMHRTVSEIAYGWGFTDMTHFGRSFRKAYGLLPSEYRRQGKEPQRRASRSQD